MIRVIRTGKFAHTYVAKCKYCDCEFTYNYNDTFRRNPNHYSDDLGRAINCPECNNLNSADLVIKDKSK